MTKTTSIIITVTCAVILAASCGDSKPDDGTGTTSVSDGGTTDAGTTDAGTTDAGTDTGWTDSEREQACSDAARDGAGDAVSELKDCECVEEEIYLSWSMDDYTTNLEKDCYWSWWGEMFLQYCQENCDQTKEFVACCDNVEAWAFKRQPDSP